MVTRCVLLLLVLAAVVHSFGIFSRPSFATKETIRPAKPKHGALKLCPPGGASFLDAFNLICPMRRKRSANGYRGGSSLERTMHQCCDSGCDFSDILTVCNPFG